MAFEVGDEFLGQNGISGAASLRCLQGCDVYIGSLLLDPFLARPLSCLVPNSCRIPVGPVAQVARARP